jgi:hypothetical protein
VRLACASASSCLRCRSRLGLDEGVSRRGEMEEARDTPLSRSDITFFHAYAVARGVGAMNGSSLTAEGEAEGARSRSSEETDTSREGLLGSVVGGI